MPRQVLQGTRSRSPRGERGLKFDVQIGADYIASRSPRGERGLKSTRRGKAPRRPRSLPSRGAWIEIMGTGSSPRPCPSRSPRGERGLKYPPPLQGPQRPPGRSPRGERGLKFRGVGLRLEARASLPSRGAWIEIPRSPRPGLPPSSLPSRGAWIEIPRRTRSPPRRPGRSPRGERGLKSSWALRPSAGPPSLPSRGAWIEMRCSLRSRRRPSSLPSRGAWIEIGLQGRGGNRGSVAPLAGSVD